MLRLKFCYRNNKPDNSRRSVFFALQYTLKLCLYFVNEKLCGVITLFNPNEIDFNIFCHPIPPVCWVGPLALTSILIHDRLLVEYVYLSTRNTASSDGPQTLVRHIYVHHSICGLIFTIYKLYRTQTNIHGPYRQIQKIKIHNKWWWCILISSSVCLCVIFQYVSDAYSGCVSAFIVHSVQHLYTAGKCDYIAADRNRAARNVCRRQKSTHPLPTFVSIP